MIIMWSTLVGTINSVLSSANIDVIINTTEGKCKVAWQTVAVCSTTSPHASPPLGTLRFAPPESPK
jgi:hypothetical protein